jgi:hypothetical protein
MSIMWQVIIGLIIGALWPAWLIVQDRIEHKAHIKRIRERREREDIAWNMWCESASDAIRNSRDVPRWPG